MDRPRLLVLTSTLPRWQGDTTPPFVLDLCRQLVSDFDVHVLAPHARGARVAETVDGIHVHRFRYLPAAWETLAYDGGIPARLRRNSLAFLQIPFFLASQFLHALGLARKLKARLIHAHWIIPQGIVAVVVRELSPQRPAVLCTAHGADLYAMRSRFARWLLRQVLQRVQGLTVVGSAMAATACALGGNPGRVKVAPMGVDVDGVFHAGTGARDAAGIVFAGRLVCKKGVPCLVDAMTEVVRQVPAARLLIIGDGPDKGALERLVQERGIGECITFAGAVTQAELAAQFRRAAVAVFPFVVAEDGDQDGLGLVVVEAQACGCPVVVTDIPAVADSVTPEMTGLVAPMGEPAALAGALIRILADRNLASRLTTAAVSKVRREFAWMIVGARYRAILNSLITPEQ